MRKRATISSGMFTTWCTLFILALVAVGLFFSSFYPSAIPQIQHDANIQIAPASITSMVWLVIDGLRADWAYETRFMPFLQSLIKQRVAHAFIAKAEPPTVTVPRIKTMASGYIHSQLDGFTNLMIEHLGAQTMRDDNLFAKLKQQNKILLSFGDSSWLQLYQEEFDTQRSTSISTMFVLDTEEPDKNATAHMNEELRRVESWDLLLLHYAGLDHAGHVGLKMYPEVYQRKLQEMDAVIEQLYNDYVRKHPNGLLLISSDHGQNENGNHGGSTSHEVDTVLMFVSQALGGSKVIKNTEQINLASTLAVLWGISIPQQNMGRVITQVIPQEYQRRALLQNAQQIEKMVQLLPNTTKDRVLELHDNLEAFLDEATLELKNHVFFQDKLGLVVGALSILCVALCFALVSVNEGT